MKTESLSELKLVAIPESLSPRLRTHLRRLEQALATDLPGQALVELQGACQDLLYYFTGAAAGLVRRLESSRPELAALASHLDSVVHYERLLRFSLSVLRSLEHPAQQSLMAVFFQIAGPRAWVPFSHARWLQISGGPEPGTQSLSAWKDQAARNGSDSPQERSEVRLYLPLLNSWLQAASGFFKEFTPVVRGERLVAFERGGFAFELLPPLSWAPPRELPPPAPPQPQPSLLPPEGPRALDLSDELPEFDFVAPDPFEKESFQAPSSIQEVLDKTLGRDSRRRPRSGDDMALPGRIEVDLGAAGAEVTPSPSPDDFKALEPVAPQAPPVVELQEWYREGPAVAVSEAPVVPLSPRLIPSEAPGEEVVTDLLEWYSELPSPRPAPPPLPAAPLEAPIPSRRRRIALPTREFVTGVRARDRKNGLGGFGRGAFKIWTLEQLDQVRSAVERTFPPLRPPLTPDYLLAEVATFVADEPHGYLLVQGPQGSGKTLVASSLAQAMEPILPVITFPIRANLQGDFQTFIEVLDEHLRLDAGALRSGFLPLGHRVTRELNVRYPGSLCAERFTAYLSELALLNGNRYLLVLDGLDEIFEGAESAVLLSDFLPEVPPDGVYVVLTYRVDGCPSRTARKLNRLEEAGGRVLTLDLRAPEYRELIESHLALVAPGSVSFERLLECARGRLGFARHLAEAVASGLLSPNDLPDPDEFYERALEALERRSGERLLKLFLLAATSYDPVQIEELSSLGVDSQVVQDILTTLPSLFRYSRDGNRPGLHLAHEAFRQHLQENYAGRYSQACERLAGRAARELLAATEPDEDLHMPAIPAEGLRSRFDRLYRWLLDSQNAELMHRAVASYDLRRLREEVCARLEHQGRFHHKLSILDGLKECLAVLVARLGRHDLTEAADLREDLAWAHNSRGLTYLKVGQFTRCLEEIERAVVHFRVLVEEEGRDELRNGLAAAFNRRSEALRYLGRPQAALESAELAVAEYYNVVVRLGRSELRYLLALSLMNRGTTHRLLGHLDQARLDLDGAVELYTQLVLVEQQDHQGKYLAEAYHARGCLGLHQGESQQAVLDCTTALQILERLAEDQDVRNDRAAIHNDRGGALHSLGDLPRARYDYGQAIEIRSDLVGEGRLDLRSELATTLTNRGLIGSQLGDELAALEDHTRSLAFRSHLIEVEGHHELRMQRAFTYLCRGASLRGLGRPREALQDYEKAIEDYLYGLNLGHLGPLALEELASAYSSAGVLHLELGEAERAADRCGNAIALLAERIGASGAELALAYNNRGAAFRSLGAAEAARDDFSEAISLYGRLVQEEGRLELLGDLAHSHLNRAGVAHTLPDHDQTIKDCSRAISLYSTLLSTQEHPEYLTHLGRALELRALAQLDLECFDQALEDVSRALERLSGQPEELAGAHLSRGQVLAAMGEDEPALEDFDRAIALLESLGPGGSAWAAELSRALLRRCRSHLKLTDTSRATRDILRAYRLSPRLFGPEEMASLHNLILTLKQQAARLLREGALEACIEVYDQAVELCNSLVEDGEAGLHGELAESLNYRAWARTCSHDLSGALEDFGRAIQLYQSLLEQGHPGQSGLLAWAYNHRGVTFDHAHQFPQALQDYGVAIELYQACVNEGRIELRGPLGSAWSHRGLLHLRQQRYREAAADLGASIEIRRGLAREERVDQLEVLASTLLSRAGALEQLGQLVEAVKDQREAAGYLFRLVDERKLAARQEDLVRCLLQQTRLELAVPTPEAAQALKRTATTLTRLIGEGLAVSPAQLAMLLEGALQLPALDLDLGDALLGLALILLDGEQPASGWGKAPDLLLGLGNRFPATQDQSRRAHCLTLATAYCDREVAHYGAGSLPRLLKCLQALGVALRQGPVPAYLSLVGPAFERVSQLLGEYPANDAFNLEVNNVAKLWQSLPAGLANRAKVARARLNQIRRW